MMPLAQEGHCAPPLVLRSLVVLIAVCLPCGEGARAGGIVSRFSDPEEARSALAQDAGQMQTLDVSHISPELQKLELLVADAKFVAAGPVLLAIGLLALWMFWLLQSSPHDNSEAETLSKCDPQDIPAAVSDSTGGSGAAVAACAGSPPRMPLGAIAMLTSYRFFTGFLFATWLPFLIAKEGAHLAKDRQGVFMGAAKLIYGCSICFNPAFGLISDRVAAYGNRSGRSAFIVVGITISFLGICLCKVGSDAEDISLYLLATAVWMLGEAMVDTTTEAIVPELVPQSQYNVSSSIRALSTVFGGLTGYLFLIVFNGFKGYSWLYTANVLLMLLCALVTMATMRCWSVPQQGAAAAAAAPSVSWRGLLFEAYIKPYQYPGGFPRACLCLFTFCLGTASIFFTLLMVRDLVGITADGRQKLHFSLSSIFFLICAVIGTLLLNMGGATAEAEGEGEGSGDATEEQQATKTALASSAASSSSSQQQSTKPASEDEVASPPSSDKCLELTTSGIARVRQASDLKKLIFGMVAFGLVSGCIPLVGLPPKEELRLALLYVIAGSLGFCFGIVFALFQACLWKLIPPEANVASAMGSSTLAKILGAGVGNFISGMLLDLFRAGAGEGRFLLSGYVAMASFSATAVLCSAALLWPLYSQYR